MEKPGQIGDLSDFRDASLETLTSRINYVLLASVHRRPVGQRCVLSGYKLK